MAFSLFLKCTMADKRKHRGPHPEDADLFAPTVIPDLQNAVRDLAWLLGRGYPERGGMKLVGDRYRLTQRQRLAVIRSTCSDAQNQHRQAHIVPPHALAGREVFIDGYNLLITIEAALSGGKLLIGRDGFWRDLASVHGTYRHVEETLPALECIGKTLEELQIQQAHWLLDRPVSNSGRLKKRMQATAESNGWPWIITLEMSPDRILRETEKIVITSDSVILDDCQACANIIPLILMSRRQVLQLVDFS